MSVRKVGAADQHVLMPICSVPPGFFVETGHYELEVRVGGAPAEPDVDLVINDAPLDRIVRRGATFFPLEIGFYAGAMSISVVRGSEVIAQADVTSDPDVAKLTRDEYADLLSEIAKSTLALYRLGGLTVPAETDPAGVRSDVVSLNLIRAHFDAFERAARRIADQPVRKLETVEHRVETLKARRVEDRALSRAIRLGGTRVATPGEVRAAPRLVAAIGNRWIDQITEARRHERVDVYENRAILGFLRWLSGSLALLRKRVARSEALPPPTRASWLARIDAWQPRIASLSRREPFAGLEPDPALRATSVFRLHPDYAAAFAPMIRMRAGLGTGSAIVPDVPLDRTFALYEMWCYVALLRAVAEEFPAARAGVAGILQGLPSPNDLGAALLSGDVSTITLGEKLTLTYQRRFSRLADGSGCKTHMIDAVPDITIARAGADGECRGLVLFDPKYRGGGSLLDGVRDLHVYRDAIRSANDEPLVRAAAAIAPRPFPYSYAKLWDGTPGPGVVAARPGHDPDVFARLLRDALQTLSTAELKEAS